MNNSLLNELNGYLDDNPEDYWDFAPSFETLQTQIMYYLTGDTTVLFDSPELHTIHAYIGGKRTDLKGNTITGNYELVKTMTNNALPTL